MAIAPLTFLEKKWASGYSGHNRLVEAATQSIDRKVIPRQDKDMPRSITPMGRRTLCDLGRWLFYNVDPVRGAVTEQATFAVQTWVSQFAGKDKEWGKLAEAWIRDHNKFCNIRGGGRNFDLFLWHLVISLARDGEQFVILTQLDGIPKLQVIPSHRVGCRSGETVVEGGPFDGAMIMDGVIMNSYGAPIGYRIYHDDFSVDKKTDVAANDCIHAFLPFQDDQIRGISPLGLSVFNWQDSAESKKFELLTQKVNAAYAMQVDNETGEADSAKLAFGAGPTHDSTTQQITTPATAKVDGVTVHYFPAGTNQGFKPIKNDRPSANSQNFLANAVREALHSIGWSIDFSLDPTKVGGAPMRVVVDKINRKLAFIRSHAVSPVCTRINGWRISKAVKDGFLPQSDEWYRWDYQGPADLTADQGYATDASIDEINNGLRAPQDEIARRGGYWEETQDKLIDWRKRLVERCKEEGITPEEVLMKTPNGNPQKVEVENAEELTERQ